jgi:Electron transfer DM13
MSAARLTLAVLTALTLPLASASAQDTTMMMKKDSMPMKGMDHMMHKDSMSMKGMEQGMMKDSSMKGMGMGMDHGMMHPMFTGRHDHKVSGSYSILDRDGGRSLALGSDFSLDGAPDPYVVLSADEMGTGSGTLVLGRLKKKSGASVFPIPAGTDLGKYSHVLIWCKKFNVTLGEAQLASSSMMMHQ